MRGEGVPVKEETLLEIMQQDGKENENMQTSVRTSGTEMKMCLVHEKT